MVQEFQAGDTELNLAADGRAALLDKPLLPKLAQPADNKVPEFSERNLHVGAEAAIFEVTNDIGNATTALVGTILKLASKEEESIELPSKIELSSNEVELLVHGAKRIKYILETYREIANLHRLEFGTNKYTGEVELYSPIMQEGRDNPCMNTRHNLL